MSDSSSNHVQPSLAETISKDATLALVSHVMKKLKNDASPLYWELAGMKKAGRPRKSDVKEIVVAEQPPEHKPVVELSEREFQRVVKANRKPRKFTEEGHARVMVNLKKGQEALQAKRKAMLEQPLAPVKRSVDPAVKKLKEEAKLAKKAAAEGKVVTKYVLKEKPKPAAKPRKVYKIVDSDTEDESASESEVLDESESTDSEAILRRVSKHKRVLKKIDQAVAKDDLASLATSMGGLMQPRYNPWGR